MGYLDTPQEYVKRQEAKELIDNSLTATKVLEIWDCLWKGDDNSEDDSKLGLCSDFRFQILHMKIKEGRSGPSRSSDIVPWPDRL